MDENKNPENGSEAKQVDDNETPSYFEKRPQLDREIQQKIRTYYLHNNNFISQLFTLVIPIIIFVIGSRMWRYHNAGGVTEVNLLLASLMVAIGGFYTLKYALKIARECIQVIKGHFIGSDEQEQENVIIERPEPEDFETEVSYLLSLPGAPSIENYKDNSTYYNNKFYEYLKIISSHSLADRSFLIMGLNVPLIFSISDVVMNIFFGETINIVFLVGLGIIFACASFMYFQSYRKFNKFFYDNAPIASYSLIEYCIFKNLWDNRK